jgi:SAM-dependent methyltransferase
MHDESRDFTLWVKRAFPFFFSGTSVLDVGAGDINGNNRFLFDHCEYEGNDVVEAKNATIVSRTKDLPFQDSTFDVIISTECFEHDPEYRDSFRKIYDMLKTGGLFCFTCASTGRPEHGTRKTTPQDSYGTKGGLSDMQDYYKNLTLEDLDDVLPLDEHFCMWSGYYNARSKDLYFVGIKRSPGGLSTYMTNGPQKYEAPGVRLLGASRL